MKRILFSPDPPETGGGAPSPTNEHQAAPAAPPPTPPPAATAVIEGDRSERETALEVELQNERSAHGLTAEQKKKREQRINELEDEIRRLKEIPAAAPKKKSGGIRWTFLEDEED